MKKPREVFLPKKPQRQWQLDNVITYLFGPDFPNQNEVDQYYIQSGIDQERYVRFGLQTQEIEQVNSYIINFEKFGENEKAIINKIIFGIAPVTVIVGTIGSGKTTLCKFVFKKISGITIPDTQSLQPLQIYLDLMEVNPEIMLNSSSDLEINKSFFAYLCIQFEFEISSIFDSDDEIIQLWDDAIEGRLSKDRPLGNEFKKLVIELKQQRIHSWDPQKNGGQSHNEIISRRRELRKKIQTADWNHCAYLCEVLSHLRYKLFKGYRWGIVIYIDNVDQISSHAQMVLRTTLFPLLRIADIRSVVMMRVSTWRIAGNDAFQYQIDSIPHTGPQPVAAVISRLNYFKKIELESFGVKVENPKFFQDQIKKIIQIFSKEYSGSLNNCFKNLTGYSIRKAFVLAQYLVASLEYPIEQKYLEEHQLKRMIIANNVPNSYVWSDKNVVDNLFQVHALTFAAPLVKSRILYLLQKSNNSNSQLNLNLIIDLMLSFDCDFTTLRYALNELMHAHKRIVWTDSILQFTSDEALQAAGRSHLFAGTITAGYISLLKDLDYTFEMVMDTLLPNYFFTKEFKSSGEIPIRPWLDIIIKFFDWLWRIDVFETVEFISKKGIDIYNKFFLTEELITRTFIPECLDQLDKIIDRTQGQGVEELRESLADLRVWLSLPLRKILKEVTVTKDEFDNEIIISFSQTTL